MLPKTGRNLHHDPTRGHRSGKFEQAIAAALRSELGLTHQAVKTLMAWTGASERTAKHWLAGTHGPRGQHFVDLARHSDAVLFYFLSAADRPFIAPGIHLTTIRTKLFELVAEIDACEQSQQTILDA